MVHAILLIALAYTLIQTKHLIIDWIWQPAYEHQNKGIYGHWGGIRHAGKNAIGTVLAVAIPFPSLGVRWVLGVLVFDFLVHYHVDWTKKRVIRRTQWGPTTHCEFWWATGADQWAHQITYIVIVTASALYVFG